MSRAIVTAPRVTAHAFPGLAKGEPAANAAAPRPEEKPDTYKDRLFKYIPGEVVTLNLSLTALIAQRPNAEALSWLIFAVGVIGTPFYLWRIHRVTAPIQLAVSTVAFVVWAFALGGPFKALDGYDPIYGAILLPIFTFFIAGVAPTPVPPPTASGT